MARGVHSSKRKDQGLRRISSKKSECNLVVVSRSLEWQGVSSGKWVTGVGETVDAGGCPDAVAWVEQSRSERTRSEYEGERGIEGLKEWRGGSFTLVVDRFLTSPTSSAFLAIHTRPTALRSTYRTSRIRSPTYFLQTCTFFFSKNSFHSMVFVHQRIKKLATRKKFRKYFSVSFSTRNHSVQRRKISSPA